jgi:hypothetical protein
LTHAQEKDWQAEETKHLPRLPEAVSVAPDVRCASLQGAGLQMPQIVKVGRATVPAGTKVEICRSFSYKLNCGNYESRDFFQSMKAECAMEHAEDISDRLHQFCKSQVMRSVREYLAVQSVRDDRKAG